MDEKLAINGGTPVRKEGYHYEAPIGDEEIQAAVSVLNSRKLSGFYENFLGGEKVQEFERVFVEYMDVKYAISLNSGTSALHVALAAIGIKEGDEVIVPAVSFTATAAAVVMVNAKPVFADVDLDTFCVDPKKIEEKISDRTKAIIPVHLYGKVAPMKEIMRIAKEHDCFVIEDACQAPGCSNEKKMAGTIGDMGVFSFVETKNLVIGEGGMIVTNDDKLAERSRLIRNHGEVYINKSSREYLSDVLGYNFRLTEVPAAIGIEQMKKLEGLNKIRKVNASFLQEELKQFKGITPLQYEDNEVCHLFPVLYDEQETGVSKGKFIEAANQEGIALTRGYPHPLYKSKIYNDRINEDEINCPAAEELCRKLICFRYIHSPFNLEDMKDVIKGFKKIFNNLDQLQ